MNVRVWKAVASAPQGTLLPREKHKLAYNKALVERHKHLPDVKRIVRHRIVPTPIYKVRGGGWLLRGELEELQKASCML